ncbi:MAG: FkbM family methyltransferase [Thermoproteota archaeon]
MLSPSPASIRRIAGFLKKLFSDPRLIHWRLRWFILRRMRRMGLAFAKSLLEREYLANPGEHMFYNVIKNWHGAYVDIGAGIGDTLIGAKKAKYIIAIEPVQENLKMLSRLANRDRRIKVLGIAVGDGETTYITVEHSRRIGTPVKTIKLDDLEFPSDDLLIKIDCEGVEHLILKGAECLLQSRKPHLLIEYHDNLSEISHELERHNYVIKKHVKDKKQRSFRHGWIHAVPLL